MAEHLIHNRMMTPTVCAAACKTLGFVNITGTLHSSTFLTIIHLDKFDKTRMHPSRMRTDRCIDRHWMPLVWGCDSGLERVPLV